MNKLVIKGAFYFDNSSDTILMPHYTGEFSIVDCNTYEKMSELKSRYDKDYIKSVKDDYIELDGVKYYSTEYSPCAVSDDWDLLSDLSELNHLEEDFNF